MAARPSRAGSGVGLPGSIVGVDVDCANPDRVDPALGGAERAPKSSSDIPRLDEAEGRRR
jgi:hypothetical protein